MLRWRWGGGVDILLLVWGQEGGRGVMVWEIEGWWSLDVGLRLLVVLS